VSPDAVSRVQNVVKYVCSQGSAADQTGRTILQRSPRPPS